MYFRDYNMTGPLVVPRMVESRQLYLQGYSIRYLNSSVETDKEIRPLRVDSIEFPDLVNITRDGMSIKHANNVSSLKLPKLEDVRGSLSSIFRGGPPSAYHSRAFVLSTVA